MPETPRITEAEWDVMQVVWDRQPVTAQDVSQALSSHKDWSVRTVKTLLARLVKKEALAYEVEGKRYLYRACITHEEGLRAESRSFLERVTNGSVSPLLAYFVEEGDLSPDEIRELRRLLAEKEEG